MIPHPTRVKAAAPLLVAGPILSLLGSAAIAFGVLSMFDESWPNPDSPIRLGLIVFGSILALAGIIMVPLGYYRLASNTDLAALASVLSVHMVEKLAAEVEGLRTAQAAPLSPAPPQGDLDI